MTRFPSPEVWFSVDLLSYESDVEKEGLSCIEDVIASKNKYNEKQFPLSPERSKLFYYVDRHTLGQSLRFVSNPYIVGTKGSK